uniref:Hexosyltransferase n=1 Tax=Craspedostauros australis TaxID=1486917 RepID=A0A7R9ZR45_9STRA
MLSRGAGNLTIHRHGDRPCRRNAIVFLAQKKHSSYKRDSFANLLEALRLLEVNYLSIDKHAENADVFIFHTGDFNSTDLKEFRASLTPASMEAIHIVDISLSRYWRRPSWHEFDDPHKWYVYPLFSEGYRRMIHFFAIDIWKFFDDYNHHMGCNYTYIMRLDEDSYIHSRIEYDLFDFMNDHSYDYGYRLCAYEMGVALPIWGKWQAKRGRNIPIHRNIEGDMCGIYNNFFIARVGYFLSWPVNSFLGFVDRQGMIYRRRLGDLMIHSMAVFAFAPKERVHRFLDFTYEHGTPDQMTGCVVWGGIQAGYKDTNARANLMKYHDEKVSAPGCDVNITYMKPPDLSPSYSHLVENGVTDEVSLHTIMVGKVERFDMGQLSG